MLAITLLVPLTGFAQPRGNGAMQGNKGMMADSMHHEPFNVETIQTIKGKVLRVEQLPGRRQNMIGVHVVIDTGEEEVAVHLGPLTNLNKAEFKITEGEVMEATGSRIMHENKPALLATEVMQGGQTLKLRDADGKPVWRGMMGKGDGNMKGKMNGNGMKNGMKKGNGGH